MKTTMNLPKSLYILLGTLSLALLLALGMPARAQFIPQDTPPEGCEDPCYNLFDRSNMLEIVESYDSIKIKGTSNYAIFSNPGLQIEFTLRNRSQAAHFYVPKSMRILRQSGYCDVIVVAMADPDTNLPVQFRHIPPDANNASVRIRLFGFCKIINLPNTRGAANLSPDNRFEVNLTDAQPLDPNLDNAAEIRTVIDRALDPTNPCNINSAERVSTLASLLVQFAVFIAAEDAPNRSTMNQQFANALNPLYQRELQKGYSGQQNRIYCLLEPAGVTEPPPTATITPSIVPTLTPTATLTNTPVLFLEQTIAPISTPLGQIQDINNQTLLITIIVVLLVMLLIIAIAPSRALLTICIAGACVIIGVVWFITQKQGADPTTPAPPITHTPETTTVDTGN